MANNQEEAINRAIISAGRESEEAQEAYAAYCKSMRKHGQNPKDYESFRG